MALGRVDAGGMQARCAIGDVGPNHVRNVATDRQLREAGAAATALQAGDFDALQFA